MSVSSIASSASTTNYTSNSSDEVSQLEKQRATLEKELQKVNASKSDQKTKEAKVKQIQDQIQLIDAQIQQQKSGKTNASQNIPQQGVSSSANSSKVNNEEANELLKGFTTSKQIDVQA